jgi:DNA polymerase elongation subunit (family B)
MIINYTETDGAINLRWRDENGERVEEKNLQYKPYFFVADTEHEPESYSVKYKVKGKRAVYLSNPLYYEKGDWVNIHGMKLKKVIVQKPNDIYKVKEKFGKTYEADVPFHHRYCIDNIKEIPEYNMRKWYWDMEWLPKEHEHSDAITCIVAYDNYNKHYYQWVWFPNFETAQIVSHIDEQTTRIIFNNEKGMIQDFMETMVVKDPDMLIAWFGLKFDLPKLIERATFNGLDSRKLSPFNEVKGVGYHGPTDKIHEYSPISQPIKGRICLNLDVAFERQWNDAQRGSLPSLALDYVAETSLGINKLVSEKFPDKNEFFTRGWLEDTETYLEYALKDVEILVKIDESDFCSEAILSLQRLLIAPFDACFYASNMGSVYFMRNAWWKAPTGNKKKDREDYDGAFIYDPVKYKTHGRYENVAAFDFSGLYPSMILARNISWETKTTSTTQLAVNIAIPRDFSDITKKRMIYYKTDKLGVLPKAVLTLKDLRDEYKAKMKAATTEAEKKKWFNNQMAVKRLSASFYGIVAFQGFGWADVTLAASITASAREAIREAAFMAKGME